MSKEKSVNQQPPEQKDNAALGLTPPAQQDVPSTVMASQKTKLDKKEVTPQFRAGFSASMIEGTTRIGRCSKCNK